MIRQVNCTNCGKHLGEIGNYKITKGVTFLCLDCEQERRRAVALLNVSMGVSKMKERNE